MNSWKKKAAIISTVLVVLLVAWVIYLQVTFRLVSTSPRINNELPTSTSSIVLNFNKALDQQKMNLDEIITKNNTVSNASIDKNTLKLTLKPLDNQKRYRIGIGTVVAQNGKKINDLFIEFETKYVELKDISKKEVERQMVDVDPHSIGTVLPYETEDYYIDFFKCLDNKECISIEMKSTVPPEYYTNQKYLSSVRTRRKNAADYLTKNGIKLSDYTLVFSEPVLLNESPRGIILSEDYTGDGVPPEEQ